MLAPADVALTTDGLTAYVINIIQKCAFKFQYGEFTYVEDKNNNSLPKEFVIEQNFPNPFNSFSISIDYTNQFKRSNLIKARIKIYYLDIVNNGINSSYQANSYIARSRFAEYYRAYPISAATYLQNKMEYEGMIANIGFKAEAFNFQARVPVDKFNVFYHGTGEPRTIGNS